MLSIDDETTHAQHFLSRSDGSERPLANYLDHFAEIRRLQRFIVARAEREGVPVIENEDAERTTSALLELVERAGARV